MNAYLHHSAQLVEEDSELAQNIRILSLQLEFSCLKTIKLFQIPRLGLNQVIWKMLAASRELGGNQSICANMYTIVS